MCVNPLARDKFGGRGLFVRRQFGNDPLSCSPVFSPLSAALRRSPPLSPSPPLSDHFMCYRVNQDFHYLGCDHTEFCESFPAFPRPIFSSFNCSFAQLLVWHIAYFLTFLDPPTGNGSRPDEHERLYALVLLLVLQPSPYPRQFLWLCSPDVRTLPLGISKLMNNFGHWQGNEQTYYYRRPWSLPDLQPHSDHPNHSTRRHANMTHNPSSERAS